jgi:hypothetical protein
MKTSTVVQHFVELLGDPSEATAPVGVSVNEDYAARSEENIQKWMSYLPEDCINTMIEMGWDVTT